MNAQVTPEDFQGGQHGYLDGAPATDAFQALIDRGLFADSGTPNLKGPAATAPTAPTVPASDPLATPASPPESPSTDVEPQVTEPAGEEYSSLDEYLTKSNLDRGAFLTLPVKVKVDGKEFDAPLAKLIESYQIGEHLAHRSNAFAEERRTFETARAQATQQLNQQLQQAQVALQFAAQQALGAPPVREQFADQGEWAAKQLDYNNRAQALGQQLTSVQQVQQQVSLETLQAERNRMLDLVPEWRDPVKFQEANKQLATYAATRGFNPAELSQVFDHRYVMVLRDAMRARELQAQVDTLTAQLAGKTQAALKLVRAAPPMAGPGARTTRSPQADRLQQVRTLGRAGKLAHNEDAQSAAFAALVDAGA